MEASDPSDTVLSSFCVETRGASLHIKGKIGMNGKWKSEGSWPRHRSSMSIVSTLLLNCHHHGAELASGPGKVSFLSSKNYPGEIWRQSLFSPVPKTDSYLHLFCGQVCGEVYGCVWVRGQHPGVSSFFPPFGTQGLNSCHQDR